MQILQVTEWIKILDKILSKSGTPGGKGILWVESSGGNLCRCFGRRTLSLLQPTRTESLSENNDSSHDTRRPIKFDVTIHLSNIKVFSTDLSFILILFVNIDHELQCLVRVYAIGNNTEQKVIYYLKVIIFGCTALYVVKIIWCSCLFWPSPFFDVLYRFICGRRRVVVTRNRMICLVRSLNYEIIVFFFSFDNIGVCTYRIWKNLYRK